MMQKFSRTMIHSLFDTVFVFDLDDTLYSERSYESSGITAVWNKLWELKPEISDHISLELLLKKREQWVDLILQTELVNFSINRDLLLEIYRGHFPKIELYEDSSKLLSFLVENEAKLAMITDGRSLTQRQKLKALRIEHLFYPIQISEETGYPKPNSASYAAIEAQFPNYNYVYIGDNPKKDFVTPNLRGWYTYGIKDKGTNVHSQNIQTKDANYLPNTWLGSHVDLFSRVK